MARACWLYRGLREARQVLAVFHGLKCAGGRSFCELHETVVALRTAPKVCLNL